MEYIQRIENRLNEMNITTKKMLLELGYSDGLISKWKKGAEPSAIKLKKMAEYLNVSVDYLLGLADSPMPINTLSQEDMAALEVGRKIKNLPDRDRKIVETILETSSPDK